MKKKIHLNYNEGNCILIPLRNGGYARGVVARSNGNGKVFGYFFGPKIAIAEEAKVDDTLRPENALLGGKFGDLGIIKNEWVIIGRINPWHREMWSMPPFVRKEDDPNIAILSYYDETTFNFIREEKINFASLSKRHLPEDGLMGYGFVEIKLTRLLEKQV